MYPRLIRLITLFALLICLPLQGLAAVTMPACQAHGQNTEMSVDTGQMDDMSHCDQHSSDQPAQNTPCDKCFYCHLNVTQAIIPFDLAVAMNVVSPIVSGVSQEIPDSDPSSLFRPPRLTFAQC